jgi:hypothetical protein
MFLSSSTNHSISSWSSSCNSCSSGEGCAKFCVLKFGLQSCSGVFCNVPLPLSYQSLALGEMLLVNVSLHRESFWCLGGRLELRVLRHWVTCDLNSTSWWFAIEMSLLCAQRWEWSMEWDMWTETRYIWCEKMSKWKCQQIALEETLGHVIINWVRNDRGDEKVRKFWKLEIISSGSIRRGGWRSSSWENQLVSYSRSPLFVNSWWMNHLSIAEIQMRIRKTRKEKKKKSNAQDCQSSKWFQIKNLFQERSGIPKELNHSEISGKYQNRAEFR